MAMNKTNYSRDRAINALRGTTPTAPATIYLALYTSDPTVTGAAGTEVSGGAYARQVLTLDAPSPPGETQNVALTYPAATASWGAVSHLGIMDALTLGNMLYFGPWSASKTVSTDDVVQVLAGDLELNET